MNALDSLSPEELSLLASVIASSLSKGRTSDELNVLGNFVAALGTLILTIAAQKQSIESFNEKKQQIKDLKKEIKR